LSFSAASKRRWRARVVVPVAALGVAAVAVPAFVVVTRPDIALTGLTNGALLSKSAVSKLRIVVSSGGTPATRVTARVDGRRVPVQREGKVLVVDPGSLADGPHHLTVSASGGLFGSASTSRTFTVDTEPPTIQVDPPQAGSLRAPVTLHGTAPGATSLTADGKRVPLHDGAFSVSYPTPPAAVDLVARDAAGNEARTDYSVVVQHPMMRAVHMTALAWTSKQLRDPILDLVRAGKINTVEVDIKDEDGIVGYDSAVPLAQQVGAASDIYDAKQMLATIHGLGARVVGRLVCFRDPKLAQWAWDHGQHDMVIQDKRTGQPWAGSYGTSSFTNFANPQVRQYNIDLATEAARLGFDDILYDYVRRPDGDANVMIFPGLTGTPSQSVASFVAATRDPVRKAGAFLGVSVFGVAADRPREIAQDIPLLGNAVDYVAPMVYPSHWAKGEYGVPNPNAQPYDIVVRSLKKFQDDLKGTPTQVMPWLQDFSLGVPYGAPEVRAQIKAAADDGIGSFLLWNAGARYTPDALDVIPK
jgi:hypothetical protein